MRTQEQRAIDYCVQNTDKIPSRGWGMDVAVSRPAPFAAEVPWLETVTVDTVRVTVPMLLDEISRLRAKINEVREQAESILDVSMPNPGAPPEAIRKVFAFIREGKEEW